MEFDQLKIDFIYNRTDKIINTYDYDGKLIESINISEFDSNYKSSHSNCLFRLEDWHIFDINFDRHYSITANKVHQYLKDNYSDGKEEVMYCSSDLPIHEYCYISTRYIFFDAGCRYLRITIKTDPGEHVSVNDLFTLLLEEGHLTVKV